MPRIKIVGPENTSGPYAGYGTRLFIDGREVEGVHRIELSPITVDSVPTLTVEMFLDADSEIELSAEVAATIAPTEAGSRVIEIATQNGNRRYRIVREGATA